MIEWKRIFKAMIFAVLGTILVLFWIPFMLCSKIDRYVFAKLADVLYDWHQK